ncbi:MAG TPA: OstA-like protein [Bacteroidia bacterium]|nr:OstA-like protein [Bacteroidia bacterium]
MRITFPAKIWMAAVMLLTALSASAQDTAVIHILHADVSDYSESKYGRANRFVGNVGFRHDNVTMYCDSAYLFRQTNSFIAYNNVRIYQGDSITLTGDTLYYEGNTRKALLKGKAVVLDDKKMTLTTDALNYETVAGMGYYTTGGRIISKENNMVSRVGIYNTHSKTFEFKDSIVLVNPEYTMYTDTMQYNTATQYAYFFGPTRIITKDTTLIYCEEGWYNTKINYSQIKKNSYVETKDKRLSADSMVYTGKTAIDEAYGNILLVDTTSKIEIRGQRGTYNRNTNIAWVTKAANGQIKVEDDTLFITADTLMTWFDSVRKNRTLYTFHHTKFFKKDLQGKCDSLQYSFADSVINMEVNPVIWSDQNQITADTIRLYMKNAQVSSIKMFKNTFIVSEKDPEKYNQVKGRNAEGFFHNKKLKTVHVNQDVENIYYVEEDSAKYIGMEKVACGSLRIEIDNNKIVGVYYINSPAGNLYPMDKIPDNARILKGFTWLIESRPTKADVMPVYVPEPEPEKKPEPVKEPKKKEAKTKQKKPKK